MWHGLPAGRRAWGLKHGTHPTISIIRAYNFKFYKFMVGWMLDAPSLYWFYQIIYFIMRFWLYKNQFSWKQKNNKSIFSRSCYAQSYYTVYTDSSMACSELWTNWYLNGDILFCDFGYKVNKVQFDDEIHEWVSYFLFSVNSFISDKPM